MVPPPYFEGASRRVYYERFQRYPVVFPTTPSIRQQMDILKSSLDHSMAYNITEVVIVNNWHGGKHRNPGGWDGMERGDHFKCGHRVGTPWDPLLGRVQGLKGLRGLPRFPELGSSPRGTVAEKIAQRARTLWRTSAHRDVGC